jgi:hypothetical protein
MKKHISTILVLLFMTVLTLPAVAQDATPAAAGSASEHRARAEKARQMCVDFQAPAYFPSDWEAVEEQFNGAQNDQNAELLSSIADTYEALFKKTIPLYAQAREDEIISKRDELIHTGFTSVFRNYLQNADTLALQASDQYQAEDYYTARDTAATALNEYEILLAGAKVFIARQEVIDRGFLKYDLDNFAKADAVAETAMALYEAGDKQGASDNAEEALLRFNIVLTNGWIAYAAEHREAAVAERERAIENKVNVAMRESFREADAIFTHAEEFFNNENFENAGILFVDAEARFAVAGVETKEKRLRAEHAIRLAEERLDESVGTAIEAERIIEGGSTLQGGSR